MISFSKHLKLIFFSSLLLLLVLVSTLYINAAFIGSADTNRQKSSLIPVAVLGDSDSHSYRDSYDNLSRGGNYQTRTFNWLELWARLSADEIYPGATGVWGSHYRIARIKNLFMLKSRSPKKLDYEYNYAVSGLGCQSLLDDWPYQGKWLLNELKSNPEYWRNGLVIIKIGINNIGKNTDLLNWKNTGLDAEAASAVTGCVDAITKMSDRIIAQQPGIKVAISGITRNYNFIDEWHTPLNPEDIQNIESVLSEFDSRLQRYASGSTMIAYIDDHYWFNQTFGSKESGDLKSKIHFTEGIDLINASGDEPINMLLQDHHTGTLYNALWITHLITEINQQLGLTLSLPTRHDVIRITELIPASETDL